MRTSIFVQLQGPKVWARIKVKRYKLRTFWQLLSLGFGLTFRHTVVMTLEEFLQTHEEL